MQPPAISASSMSQPISFSQSVKEGIGLGVGSAIGHRIISSLFGSPTTTPASASAKQEEAPCASQKSTFDTCIKERKEVMICQEHLDSYHKCLDQSVQR